MAGSPLTNTGDNNADDDEARSGLLEEWRGDD